MAKKPPKNPAPPTNPMPDDFSPFAFGEPDGCFMEPDPDFDRPVGALSDSQLGAYIRQTIHKGDVGMLLFVCSGQVYARRVGPPA